MSLPLLTLFIFACSLSVAPPGVQAKHHHNNNNRLMELLTAGIVAKVLQKQEGDEGEHHEYYPVPIHVPVHHHGHGHHDHHGSGSHHHHVTEKIIPIPIPHHTTRIIHINADKPHSLKGGGGSSFDLGGAMGGSLGGGGQSYDSDDQEDDPPPPRHHSGSSPSIQQIYFHDNGVYAPQPQQQQVPRYPHQGYSMRYPGGYSMPYRRPGMMPAGAHPAYMVMRPRYPYVAMRPRMPPVPAYGAPPMYPMPYRRTPTAASYMSPIVVRRPYPLPVMPPMWK